MSNKPTLDPNAPLLRLDGHRRPVTRRDFLGRGLISGAGIVLAPSLLSFLIPRKAAAQFAPCSLSAGAGKIPFLCLDLAGGANLAGSNVLVGGPGGQLDFLSVNGYSRLGLPANLTPDRAGQVDAQFGLLFHSDSALLRGMISKTSQTTRDRTNGTVICARSENDTQNNPHNPMYGINKAGANGNLVALIGTQNSDSGGSSNAPMEMIDPTVRPTKVSSGRDAMGLVDTGKLVQLLDQADAAAVMAKIEQLSDVKLNRIAEDASLESLIHCGYVQTTDLVATFGDPTLLDPANDAEIAGANGIFTGAELAQGRFQKTAAVMKLVVDGYAGAGTIENGGYDYHDGTRATGEVRDFLAGQMIGACLEFAARKNQQLMLYVFSDGALDSDGVIDNSTDGRGKGSWRGDNSSTAASILFVFDPAGRPALVGPGAQIGYYRDEGSIETAATRVSNNVTLLAQSIVLNYMALHNDVGNFANALPNHGLGNTPADLNALIAFAPIR
jgi:hypothetical protein